MILKSYIIQTNKKLYKIHFLLILFMIIKKKKKEFINRLKKSLLIKK